MFEFRLRRVELSNDHQIAAKNLVRLRVSDIDLKRLRQRLNGFSNSLLRELAVPQGVPTPRRFRVFLHISSKHRLNILKPSFADIAFEFADAVGVVSSTALAGERSDFLPGQDVTRIELHRLSIGRRGALRIALLFKNCPHEMLGIRGFRLKLKRMLEFSSRSVQVTFIECNTAFRDIQSGILIPIVGRS